MAKASTTPSSSRTRPRSSSTIPSANLPPATRVLFGREYRGETLGEIDNVSARVTANGHYLVVTVSQGTPAKHQWILLKDLRVPDSLFVPLVYGIDARFREINVTAKDGEDDFYVETDYLAPNHRVLKAVLGKPPTEWATVIPEGKDVIEGVSIVDGKLYVLRLHDVQSELTAYTLDGKPTGQIKFPGIGAGSGLQGRPQEEGRLLYLPVHHHAADDLPLRHHHRQERCLQPGPGALQLGRL